MDDLTLGEIFALLVLLLVLGAWFSAAETSMMALNRHRLNALIRKGNKAAKLTAKLLSKIDKLLGSILFGNTLLNVAAAAVTNLFILRVFGASELALLLGTLGITFVLLVVSEILPKILAASHPERIALPSSYLLAPLITLFHPVVSVASALVKGIFWLLRIKIQTDHSQQKMTLDDLRGLMLEAHHFLPRKQQKMLLNLVDLERITVNDVMVPRNQIEALNLNTKLEELRQQIVTSHHVLLPVYADNLDNIVGILHLKRALAWLRDDEPANSTLQNLLLDPYFIPADTPLLTQLQHFQEKRLRLGLVVDEYGELLGLVTLEQILEEIVGEFTTQSPHQTGRFLRQDHDSLLMEGSISVRELNRKFGFHFPLDGAKTLNGLILEHLQDIPEAGTSLKIANHPIEIVQTQGRVVKVVRIFPALPCDDEAAD